MKGIILAGGHGSRLWPITKGVSKQLLPVFDKPMIYYPISILMLAGIREILIISTPDQLPNYKKILGKGNSFGITISYLSQQNPNGLAEAFIIGEKFIGTDSVCLTLGDNIFYGEGFVKKLRLASKIKTGCQLFAYPVKNPSQFGIVTFNKKKIPTSIIEKPKKSKSNLAITGLYFYDNKVINIAKKIKPSKRNELEITSINQEYLKLKKMKIEIFGRGNAWLDMGTPETLLDASLFIQTIQQRQGFKIACLEEIALKNEWINKEQLKENLFKNQCNNEYAKYLKGFLL
ncbi:glucose-1-phosphate thymidylyltransferase RfbA [Pelagibacteraceae bacterium]|nr:glucose-1-phosphate thymidylyltransferase RfbA [Pelagibacteraceae bacterium]